MEASKESVAVFRPEYRELTPQEKQLVDVIKGQASILHTLITQSVSEGADPRCGATAKTKLEESIMWAVKGITGPKSGA